MGLINSNITGSDYVGAISGYNQGIIRNCYAVGDINSAWLGDRIGGLVGYNTSTGIIQDNYTSGSVIGWEDSVGGLIGVNEGTVINNYSLANVYGQNEYTGGLIGNNSPAGNVINNYTTGTVIGGQAVGGLVGGGGAPTYLTNNFTVSHTSTTLGIETTANGLFGEGFTTLSGNYWDVYLTNRSNCTQDGNSGCTSTYNQASSYYGASGIPFTELDFDGNWIARDNNYPILYWQE